MLSDVAQMLFGKEGQEVQRFQLFDSSLFGEKDLLFRDATEKLSVFPDNVDVSQVLGLDYVALLKSLRHEGADHHWCVFVIFYTENKDAVVFCSPSVKLIDHVCAGSSLEDSVMRWCCISHAEQKKCEQWALNINSDPLVCVRGLSVRDCIMKIKVSHLSHVRRSMPGL